MEIYRKQPSQKEFVMTLQAESDKPGTSKSVIQSREGDFIEL